MRRQFISLASILACLSAFLFVGATQAEEIKLVTWNLQWFPGKKPISDFAQRKEHMEQAKSALDLLSPDIFCAQEIRDWDSFAELVEGSGMQVSVVSRHRDSPKGGAYSIQQVAIASKYQATSSWAEPFKINEATPPRGFAFASFEIKGSTVLVYSVHFKSNLTRNSDRESNFRQREEAARQIVAHSEAMREIYGEGSVVLVCGDFNTDKTDPRFSEDRTFAIFESNGFRWGFEGMSKTERITHLSGKFPPACFDGFFVRGGITIKSCLPVSIATKASDHIPVKLVFSIK